MQAAHEQDQGDIARGLPPRTHSGYHTGVPQPRTRDPPGDNGGRGSAIGALNTETDSAEGNKLHRNWFTLGVWFVKTDL